MVRNASTVAALALVFAWISAHPALARTTVASTAGADGIVITIDVPIDIVGELARGMRKSPAEMARRTSKVWTDKLNEDGPYRGCYRFKINVHIAASRRASRPRPGRHGLGVMSGVDHIGPLGTDPFVRSVSISTTGDAELQTSIHVTRLFGGVLDGPDLPNANTTRTALIDRLDKLIGLPGCLRVRYALRHEGHDRYTNAHSLHLETWKATLRPDADGRTLRGKGTFTVDGEYSGQISGTRKGSIDFDISGSRTGDVVTLTILRADATVYHTVLGITFSELFNVSAGAVGFPFSGELKKGRIENEGLHPSVDPGMTSTFKLLIEELQ